MRWGRGTDGQARTMPATIPSLQILAPLARWSPSMESIAMLMPPTRAEVTKSQNVFHSNMFAGNLRSARTRSDVARTARQQMAEMSERTM